MRNDLEMIKTWVKPNTRVLDLGCGDGSLLKQLSKLKGIHGYGIEISEEDILRCVANGVNVVEQDIDKGLANFDDQSFDTVIMSQAIQTMYHPEKALEEMVRVGRQCIVTFPNFGYWRARFQLALRGMMPVSENLPYEWYNTPNIHFCTFRDFDTLCKSLGLKIINREVITDKSFSLFLQRRHPNLFGETALYRISR